MSSASKLHTVYDGLRRAIIEQALAPATKLPEDAIGERFGVSRTIVRAALARLASEGLVDVRPNRGASVASPTLEEAHDIFVVRRGLERIAMEILAGRPLKLAPLINHIEAEENALGRDGPESIRLAGEFHLLLAEATGNAFLARSIGEVVSRCSLILALYGRPHSSECAVNEHRLIVEALEARDAERASSLMGHHLDSVVQRALLDSKPERARDIREILAPYVQAIGIAPRRARRADNLVA